MRYLEETFGEDGDSYGGFESEMIWNVPAETGTFPENGGYPCVVLIECGGEQPRWNNPRIKFCADKRLKCPADDYGAEYIPMMICDEPHIPEGFEHIKHNLTDEELDYLKEWIVNHKEQLLDLGEGKTDYITFWKEVRGRK